MYDNHICSANTVNELHFLNHNFVIEDHMLDWHSCRICCHLDKVFNIIIIIIIAIDLKVYENRAFGHAFGTMLYKLHCKRSFLAGGKDPRICNPTRILQTNFCFSITNCCFFIISVMWTVTKYSLQEKCCKRRKLHCSPCLLFDSASLYSYRTRPFTHSHLRCIVHA